MSALKLSSVCKYFGGVQAANNVSFTVNPQTIHGLIGPNGSGKTTIFNCLTGVYPLTSGEILFNGTRIDGKKPHQIAAGGIARTFQNLRLFGGLTVLENILVGRHVHMNGNAWTAVFSPRAENVEHTKSLEKAAQLTAFCGLKGRENELSKDLPYGLQRRLEIARALALEPTLLMLDEPAAGMNPAETKDLQQLIRQISDLGIIILLIEHNVKLVMGLCNTITVMDTGEVIAEGTPDQVSTDARVIEAYLGKDNE